MEQTDDIDLFSFERTRDELFEPEYEPIYNKDGVEVEKGRKDPYGVIYSLDGKRLIKSTDRHIGGYKIRSGVERICDDAFYLSEIDSVTFPPDVISIGDFAFWCCLNLEYIEFPESLSYIGKFAFYHCWHLRNLIFPKKLSRIGGGAFGRIFGSLTVESQNPIPPICESAAFMNADLSKSILIVPSGAREAYSKAGVWRRFRYIAEYDEVRIDVYNKIRLRKGLGEEDDSNVNYGGVIYDSEGRRLIKCENKDLVSHTIKPGTEVICEQAFMVMDKMKEIAIPGSVKIIGESAFYSCGVEKVTFGNGVETIGGQAFACCYVDEVTIPHSVKYIGDFAFSDCKSLTDVFIEGEVNIIGCGTFEGCPFLKHVLIPKSVTVIERRAWKECESLETFVSLNPIPPACENGAFEKVPVETCVVYVPKGAKVLYSKVNGWKDFKNIVEIDEALVFQKLR